MAILHTRRPKPPAPEILLVTINRMTILDRSGYTDIALVPDRTFSMGGSSVTTLRGVETLPK